MKKITMLFLMLVATLMIGLTACGAGEGDALPDVDDTSSADDQAEETEGTDDEDANDNVLVMATSPDYPPFESLDVNGEFVGFDIELAKLIAEELGMELEIRDMKFDGLIGALQAGRVDMVLSGMSATENRRENVDFSIEYHSSGEMFVTRKDEPMTALEDLEGKTVGVQLGTIQEEGARAIQEDYGFELKALDDAQMLVQELITNRVDVIYLDKQVAKGFIEAQDLAGFDDPTDASPGMAVAFPKGSALVEDVNAAIQSIIDSGQLQALEEEFLAEEE
ncbi:arginine-binding extracellular protein ArtP [Halolactibacillus alkaliphilus]|uniref:Arginine-binding extracellular protein ArtP n=1 Tax=Halolactibacillus alkaliphilus TaxID=442899 RepID=A0A511X3V8_9BACI|nr:transporter substrate-binding domain-containing protein [Halolactibacillus alkaliphilus]GEN57639.1 arginine-binding extracellular protein ArtP [Halolactibacillus alkaliphilus]GGN74488.1 arginine-binding extracellular protein ArtP [Halolactibacillus alkaliphilus]SFP01953.1 polar amino acid transport system substrate-binding protein [Halolactibacillus alkaliphilus]